MYVVVRCGNICVLLQKIKKPNIKSQYLAWSDLPLTTTQQQLSAEFADSWEANWIDDNSYSIVDGLVLETIVGNRTATLKFQSTQIVNLLLVLELFFIVLAGETAHTGEYEHKNAITLELWTADNVLKWGGRYVALSKADVLKLVHVLQQNSNESFWLKVKFGGGGDLENCIWHYTILIDVFVWKKIPSYDFKQKKK